VAWGDSWGEGPPTYTPDPIECVGCGKLIHGEWQRDEGIWLFKGVHAYRSRDVCDDCVPRFDAAIDTLLVELITAGRHQREGR
jgi:hypothetical protein